MNAIPENMTSDRYCLRDTERFYDYPPVLSEISEADIWVKQTIQLYIHIPFCLKKCNYCPYFKIIYNKSKADEYVAALNQEIDRYALKHFFSDCIVNVVYIGGGTPGCLNENQLSNLVPAVMEKFNISDDAQITLELNPSTVTKEKLKLLKSYGVNRISIGVQSFDDQTLKRLGRVHNRQQAVHAVESIREAGFDHINIDLLYKTPGQTVSQLTGDLNTAISLEIDHISLFGLNIKPNTRFYEMADQLPETPDLSVELAMVEMSEELLKSAGFQRYSIDAFCLDNQKNRYSPYNNQVLGLGAGAFSHINGAEFNNYHGVDEYIEQTKFGLPVHLGKKLTMREEIERYMVYGVFNLKLDKNEFKERFGVDMADVFGKKLDRMISDQLMADTGDHYHITEKGFFYIFNISKEFFAECYKLFTDLL